MPATELPVAKIKKPNYTQIPNVILDQVNLFTAEQFKIIIFISRKFFGWKHWTKAKRTVGIKGISLKTGVSKSCVKTSLLALKAKGFITVEKNVGEDGRSLPNTYGINVQEFKIRKDTRGREKATGEGPGKSQYGSPDGQGRGRETARKEKETFFIETLQEEQKQTVPGNLPEPSVSPQDQNLQPASNFQEPTPLPDSGFPLPGDEIVETSDFRTEMELRHFVKYAYGKTKGAKVTSTDITKNAERLEECEAEYGVIEFRGALLNFLASDNNKVRASKWALSMFLRDPLRNMDSSPRSTRQTGGYKASAWAAPSVDTSRESAARPAEDSPDPALLFVDKWNTINPDRPVGALMAATAAKVRAAAKDEDFVRVHEELFTKVGKFIAAGQDIDFAWMFTGREPNWVGTMEGKYNFFLAKKPGGNEREDMWSRLTAEAKES